jgi:hypothetical protein
MPNKQIGQVFRLSGIVNNSFFGSPSHLFGHSLRRTLHQKQFCPSITSVSNHFFHSNVLCIGIPLVVSSLSGELHN